MRRIVFETTVSRRVVRRRDDDAVSQSLTAVLAVPAQDGMGDRRGRCGGTVVGDADLHIIGRQDFKRTAKGRFRQGMRISAHEQRAGDTVLFAVITDGLGDGVDVAFVEGLLQRRTTMPGRSKRHTLCGLMRVRRFRIVGTDERGDILQSLGRRQFAGMGMYCHDGILLPLSIVYPVGPQVPDKKEGGLKPPSLDCISGLFSAADRNRAEDVLTTTVDLQHDGASLAALACHDL